MQMNTTRLLALCMLAAALGGVARPAQAEQPRDWMIDAAKEGHKVNVDLVYPGMQVGYEYTRSIYGKANSITVRGSDLLTAAFNDNRIDADLRLVIFTLGASVGYRDNWRTHIYRPDQPIDRAARRNTDNTSTFKGSIFDFGNEDWAYFEGRLSLALPFNDWAVYNGTHSFLFEGRPDRSLDWRNGVVRDHDMMFKSEQFLLFKHRKFGGLGPMFQLLNYSLDASRTTQLNYGLMYVGRPGFARANDLLLVQTLFHFGSALGGDDNRDFWGAHNLYSSGNTLVTGTKVPFGFLLAYRMVFNL